MTVSRACGHSATAGEWLSLAHAVICIGVQRDDLAAAVRAGDVRSREVGWARHVEILRADVEARWPLLFVNRTQETRA